MRLNTYAPVLLFGYRRPFTLWNTLRALRKNPESRYSRLIMVVDGPRGRRDLIWVMIVRFVALFAGHGFAEFERIIKRKNDGLARSIRKQVTATLEAFETVIVVEDDIVVSPMFLRFMNESLVTYRRVKEVYCISGYIYPVEWKRSECFFIRGADCWGWATWRDRWSGMSASTKSVVERVRNEVDLDEFDPDGLFGYWNMLNHQLEGKIDSWAVFWHAISYLEKGLTLYPPESYVTNIGFGRGATHHSDKIMTHTKHTTTYWPPGGLAPVEDQTAKSEIVSHFRKFKKGKKRQVNR